MSKQVQLRRGTTTQHSTFTGAAGEVTYDTDRKCLVVHDGVTAGGLPILGSVLLAPGNVNLMQNILSRVAILGGSYSSPALTVLNAAYFGGPTTIGDLLSSVAYLGGVGTVTIDFALGRLQILMPLYGDVTFATANRLVSRVCQVSIPCGATGRNLSFPAGWIFVGGAAPASIAANKTALLELWCTGSSDTEVIARYSVQP
jgi:hypothetical protein